MLSLLHECQFTKLTVGKICREEQISRATFYSHFTYKHNLLEFWLLSFRVYRVNRDDTCEDLKEPINQFVNENKKIFKNLLIDADDETLEIVLNFLCLVLDMDNATHIEGEIIQKNIVTANLYIGGILYYLLWQVKNDFPPDVPRINDYSYTAIKKLWDWAKE